MEYFISRCFSRVVLYAGSAAVNTNGQTVICCSPEFLLSSLHSFHNTYELVGDAGEHFVAERQDYSSADADGPDGSGDGYVAFNELSSEAVGSSPNFLQAEIWKGEEEDYIGLNDLPGIDCPSPAVRYLASLDVMTKNGNWNKSDESFSIEVN